ncbi:hypothetical protein TPADAL_0841a [Treponema pallidum subsp. pallidum DAL-1]|uniref:Uncharacterized protein n=2 Tax=Treponema pallidum TaxID=160 RepID=A0AAU8SAX8_TREPL|nr:hypothetical protein TPESAMD_0841a [Treponema pallidum subsp. pertenue str. SamoaD]AEZ59043.1 hypothetical protein TPECDC2_0841a [Treponema pallidum subsp. pertenue str. CDC2]AEZ60111.1 hypothetical protein TPEGAU_0841a [Treponema pallidum subsp. pertenue str. Gauthier]AEZ61171.1 hypothetical protein TPADAL_0841a [Treponema pallidum subsp. pallidum DAL-1]AGK84495.1 hypothetical protein TPFB_0841a [Treponema pallidum str. Fribourg-Blanc]AJB40871.1 hypothetical protein TENDBA_0841a [Treponema
MYPTHKRGKQYVHESLHVPARTQTPTDTARVKSSTQRYGYEFIPSSPVPATYTYTLPTVHKLLPACTISTPRTLKIAD